VKHFTFTLKEFSIAKNFSHFTTMHKEHQLRNPLTHIFNQNGIGNKHV